MCACAKCLAYFLLIIVSESALLVDLHLHRCVCSNGSGMLN